MQQHAELHQNSPSLFCNVCRTEKRAVCLFQLRVSPRVQPYPSLHVHHGVGSFLNNLVFLVDNKLSTAIDGGMVSMFYDAASTAAVI